MKLWNYCYNTFLFLSFHKNESNKNKSFVFVGWVVVLLGCPPAGPFSHGSLHWIHEWIQITGCWVMGSESQTASQQHTSSILNQSNNSFSLSSLSFSTMEAKKRSGAVEWRQRNSFFCGRGASLITRNKWKETYLFHSNSTLAFFAAFEWKEKEEKSRKREWMKLKE